MELILISSSKLKIMLSDEDMEKYDLKAETVDYDNTATRRAFWSILDDAKNETGFDAASDRLFIQMYPSKDGGCEMFVTKLGTLCAEEAPPAPCPPDRKRQRSALSPKGEERTKERLSVYSFESLEWLLEVCRRLLRVKWKGRSRAYKAFDGKCYLFLYERGEALPLLTRFSFIGEYGIAEHAETVSLYIKEYASPLCENAAVETLGAL